MKNNVKLGFSIVFLFIPCLLFSNQQLVEETIEKANSTLTNGWELVWEQNFDSCGIKNDPVSFDTGIWTRIPRGTPQWQKYMSSYDSCYAFEDGNLILRGIKNTTQKNDTAPYLTGGWYTKGKKSFGFGRMEIRARLQSGQGAWPALWMMPATNVKWPLAGEIDIMERINYEQRVKPAVHSHYIDDLKNENPQSSKWYSINLENTYNVYAVEKYLDSLVFYVNNNKVFTYPRIKNLDPSLQQYPFSNYEFYLILSMQLGGNWAGNISDKDLPNEMRIDWIRFYELITTKNTVVPDDKKLFLDANIVSNQLKINGIENNTKYRYFVSSLEGRIVLEGILENSNSININSLSSAYYILYVLNTRSGQKSQYYFVKMPI
jgi:beta-glucanase (GH16 family)